MRRPVSRSRFTLMPRRWHEQISIAAPRVAVHTPTPWYWRAVAIVLLLGSALALANWAYNAGQLSAGFDQKSTQTEIDALRAKAVFLEEEVTRLRSITNTSESNLQIDRTTVSKLTEQVRVLEEEKIELKENLAVFENLAAGGGNNTGLSLGRLRIEPDTQPGKYRYRILASIFGDGAKQEFKGNLQLQVMVQDASGHYAIIALPRADDPDSVGFSVSFRAFRSLEGSFQIPDGMIIKRVEARLLRDGATLASQSTSL